MQENVPALPLNAFRLTLTLEKAYPRLDQVLLIELRKQTLNSELKHISRKAFKDLFKKRRVSIKGQFAVPSSPLAKGTTYVDILGVA